MKNASVSGDISGMSLTSETGTFENLVGKYLRSRSLENPAWGRTTFPGENCSPTTFNRVQQAMSFVYGKDILGNMSWSNSIYRRWQGDPNTPGSRYGEVMIPDMGYGTTVTENGIIDGDLTTGAVLRLTQTPGPSNRHISIPISWHAVIFLNYTTDDKGVINGMTYWQQTSKSAINTINFNFNNGGTYNFLDGYKPKLGANFK